jgi:hypothetical protein
MTLYVGEESMTTPQYPDPNQPPDPSAYQPPSGAQQPGVEPQPGTYPPPGQPGDYPPPGQAGAYPPPGQPGAYPPPGQPGAYPPPGQAGAYPPPGQAGSYPPPGTPGGPVMPPAPGEQPKKSGVPRVILGVAVVVIVVLGVVLYIVNRQSDPATAAVGDCVRVNSVSTTDADLDKVDCTDPDAAYKVTATGTDESCDTAESTYYEENKDGDTTTTLCLQPNVQAGDCFKIGDNADSADAKVQCGDTKGEDGVVKVLKFDHTTSDPSVCPDGTEQYLNYTVHQGVLCVKPNS